MTVDSPGLGAHQERSASVRRNRPRGLYVPIEDVPRHLHGGWKVLDDCPTGPGQALAGTVLMLPPEGGGR